MCKTVLPVCIETSDDYDWRSGLYDDVETLLGESTRSRAIDASCLFTRWMLPALDGRRAPRYGRVLSTPTVDVEYCVETGVNVR